ncbi:MAG TPA: sensor histidine kinase [Thermoanaerobaculia bacterium]|nr:sensor histidine kinase [Thermoanaerobaculia bacterium]
MAFRIAARTLLELGAELIGSDAAAVFELVKNAVDARSPVVRITVQSVLPHSRYQQALELLAAKEPALDGLRELLPGWIVDEVPPEARRRFLRRIVDAGDDVDAVRGALDAAYDAENFIEISDDGDGMSLRELDDVYLTIGTRSRRHEKETWNGGTEPGRVLLGDKGVGRLSTMRLGEVLHVQTSRTGEAHWNVLDIDWRQFSHSSDALLEEIPVAPKRGRRKDDAASSGTTIRISHLRSDWHRGKVGALLRTEFARMVDPFDRRRANRLFRIMYNGERLTLPQMAARLFEVAHAIVTCRLGYDAEGHAHLTGDFDYRLHTLKKKPVSLSEVELLSVTKATSPSVLRSLGPFHLEFLWFNRKHLTAIEGLGTRNDVLDLVRQWGGGLMVFRDQFRIQPYGGPDDDWLELDKRAFGRRGYKLNRQQIIGRVNLTWRNRHLTEQTNREGLVDNDHKAAFVFILQRILEDFKAFSDDIEEELKREELTSLEVLKERVLTAKTEVQRRIRQIAADAPEQAKPLREVERLVQQLTAQIDGVDEIVEDYKDERRKFVHLAGLGLMVELILHELGRATTNTLGTLESVDAYALPGRLPAVFDTLATQLKTLQKRIQTLDPLSTARRQVKETFAVRDVVEQIVDARATQAARHRVDVRIDADSDKPWRIRAVKGMLIQILENLLANSFYWLKYQRVAQPGFRPRITITLDGEHQTIAITDNGPGVPPSRADEIFLPFVTLKPPGEGSGLGLYIARELSDYHGWKLTLSRAGRGHGVALHTFVLDIAPHTSHG